jgi:RNA polymerase sigma factor (TIGR02999 family)
MFASAVHFSIMDVRQLLSAIEAGEPEAAETLLPVVYDELRRLAAAKLSHEQPGQTLSATALVHEAYLRLVGGDSQAAFHNRRHFFFAAAEAMRRILIDRARRRLALRHGGEHRRLNLNSLDLADPMCEGRYAELLALDEALDELAQHDDQAAKLVKLRFFAGLGHQETAESLGITRRAADRLWLIARTWLFRRLENS